MINGQVSHLTIPVTSKSLWTKHQRPVHWTALTVCSRSKECWPNRFHSGVPCVLDWVTWGVLRHIGLWRDDYYLVITLPKEWCQLLPMVGQVKARTYIKTSRLSLICPQGCHCRFSRHFSGFYLSCIWCCWSFLLCGTSLLLALGKCAHLVLSSIVTNGPGWPRSEGFLELRTFSAKIRKYQTNWYRSPQPSSPIFSAQCPLRTPLCFPPFGGGVLSPSL